MRIIEWAVRFWKTLKAAFTEFTGDNVMKLSASLSYATIFSLAPMLVIIISLLGAFFGQEAVEGRIYYQIDQLVGSTAAMQIQEMIRNVHIDGKSWIATTIGIGTFFMGATGVFSEIQSSINQIWSIRAKPKRGIVKFITNRLLSFSMVMSIGFLLLVSLIVSSMLEVFSDKLKFWFPDTMYIVYPVNLVVTAAVITALFAIIFKVLPDAKLGWKDALIGAAFTAVLFMIGKSLIGLYLSRSTVATTYGAAGSVVLILLWVYYSSTILYLGAEFTKMNALMYGKRIEPDEYAVFIEEKEVERLAPPKKTVEKAREARKEADAQLQPVAGERSKAPGSESERARTDRRDDKAPAARAGLPKDDRDDDSDREPGSGVLQTIEHSPKLSFVRRVVAAIASIFVPSPRS
jgi:membrane protein